MSTDVQRALGRREAEDFAALKRDLRRREKASATIPAERLGFTADDPAYPLGRGMPLGGTLREDGESHRMAWMRVVRADPCSFCGRAPAGTVDHIEPKSKTVRGLGGAHTWLNFTAACANCNAGKKDGHMLLYLRARHRPIRLDARAA